MKTYQGLSLFLLMSLLISCGSSKKITHSIFEEQYYVDLEKNIKRLHQLSLGTFVAYADSKEELEEVWKVSGQDSVILYSIPLGEVSKDGYWILNYEFMTSLPNTPVYTSIKQIKQIDRDSFHVLYYEVPAKLTLAKILEKDYLKENVVVENLKQRDKKAFFMRQTAANFLGRSLIYEDKEASCLRQNIYSLTPAAYAVSVDFFDLKTKELLDKKNRPNLMMRREVSQKTLQELSEKE